MIRSRLLLCLITVSLLMFGCSEEKKEPVAPKQEAPPLPVDVITVNKEQVPLWFEFTGKTEASKRVEVRARVAGRLENILFREGDYVEEGETMFELEKDSFEASLTQAKAARKHVLPALSKVERVQ